MKARFATEIEISKWNSLVLNNPDGGNVFSSFEYAMQKKLTGYRPLFIMVGEYAVTVLEKRTFPLGRLWYLSKGPGVNNTSSLLSVIDSIKELAEKKSVFLIKIESELPKTESEILIDHGMVFSGHIIPNSSTISIDLSPKLEDILLNLPQKGRHAIRRAERDGVTVERVKASDENCQLMYKLLQETAKGQFGVRSYKYFETFWKDFEKSGLGQLFFAYFEGKVVAGAFAMSYGPKSTYKDGASIRERTAYGASHFLQWEVIKWAKEKGSLVHDFCGSPPSESVNDKSHPLYGVGRFKLSFSKNVVDYIGCFDVKVSNTKYRLWKKCIERLHRGLYYRIKKDYYY